MIRLLGKLTMFAAIVLFSPVIVVIAITLGCFGIACVPEKKKREGGDR